MSNRSLARLLLVTYVLGFIAQILAVRSGVTGAGGFWLKLTMWAPAVAALSTSADARGLALAALRRVGLRHWPVGFAVGLSFVGLRSVLLAVSGTGHWNSAIFPLSADGASVSVQHFSTILGGDPQSFVRFALNLLLTFFVASIVFGIMGGLGEELGWRAVLQPTLQGRFGAFAGTVLVGLAWAYWHLPANLAGYNDAVHPMTNALLLFPLRVVCLAFAYGWLFDRSRSVWPVTIAHMANNSFSGGPVFEPNGWLADNVTLIVASLLIGGFFAWRLSASTRAEQSQFSSCAASTPNSATQAGGH